MKNKKLSIFLYLVLTAVFSYSQELKELYIVGQAQKLNDSQTWRIDQNGNFCAAIQVISDLDGFTYDSNDGIVKDVDNKPGKDVVYLTSTERVLEIFKAGYERKKLILSSIGIVLQPQDVWQITITGDKEIESYPVTFRFTPNDATLTIDSIELAGLTHILTAGEHHIVIEKPGFYPLIETIQVDQSHVFFEWKLYEIPKAYLPSDSLTLKKKEVDPFVFEMVLVEGGSFYMGCTNEQVDCNSNEKPAHKVKLYDYYIGKYEITQRQWQAVMDENKYSDCLDCPVTNVSWRDIRIFLKKLKKITGVRYRLPTEAEWEYAARGRNMLAEIDTLNYVYLFSGSNTIENVAWYSENAGISTHPVGQKEPNQLGIYDMTGNAWEWCSDWYDSEYYERSPVIYPRGGRSGQHRVLRGGGRDSSAWICRISFRGHEIPEFRNEKTGFRLAKFPD
ncbi:MAG: formylglycine-generating enzyme family protein [Bacteroidales bacterium]|nr:formylglycine-generating enzyme family protein [Bacteroidales bacterium]